MDPAHTHTPRAVKLYLPPDLWADIAVSAAAARRTLPSEIAFRLARDAERLAPAPEAKGVAA